MVSELRQVSAMSGAVLWLARRRAQRALIGDEPSQRSPVQSEMQRDHTGKPTGSDDETCTEKAKRVTEDDAKTLGEMLQKLRRRLFS